MGKTVVTYPKLLDETDFYMALDMSLLIDEIKVTRGKNFKCIELIKSTSYHTSMLCSRYRGKTTLKLLSRAWDIVKSACASIRNATQTC